MAFSAYLYPRLGVTQPFDPAHKHVTSPFVAPATLAAARLLLALYTLVTLLVTLIWQAVREGEGAKYLSYFTHLSYIGLCAYFFASGVHTAAFARSLRRATITSSYSYPLQRWPRPLQFLHVLLQLTITVFPIIVTVVFWVFLSSPTIFSLPFSAWSNISLHALNTVFALAETLLTDIPPAPWLSLPFGLVLLAAYLGVAYVTHAAQGWYPYTFLDPQSQHSLLAAYILGIGAAYVFAFLLVRTLAVLRVRLVVVCARRRAGWGGGGRGEREEGTETFEEWEEVERPALRDGGVAV